LKIARRGQKNDHFLEPAPSRKLNGSSEEMSQHDAIRFLQDEGLPDDALRQHLVEVFGKKATAL
jgi:hypothetical protein